MNARDVGLCLDTGHARLSGDLHGVLHKLGGHLWMIHASDNHGNRDDHLPPGRGDIDWKPVLSHLASRNFQGTLILELSGGKPMDQLLGDAQRSRKFLRDLIRRLY